MSDIVRKMTSRKFILAVVGVVAGLYMAMGGESGDIVEMVKAIAGILTAAGSAISYINAEAKVDAAAVKEARGNE